MDVHTENYDNDNDYVYLTQSKYRWTKINNKNIE